ncbi:MAG: hypothetical protein C4519_24435 [Desulfobacteraceae bacterium]|nr:MAG: hypothetical protein C4519_24435 [Desulfobacteraceae bacterium]
MVNIDTQMNKFRRQKSIEGLKQTLIRKGIYKKAAPQENPNVTPFNPKVEQIKDHDTRGAMREMRYTGISAAEYDKELDEIINKQ